MRGISQVTRTRALRVIVAAIIAGIGARPGLAVLDQEAAPAGGPCGAETPWGNAPSIQICDNGGEGASACETKHVISVGGWGSVSSCGVSCVDGHYACCQDPTVTQRAQCSCVQERQRGPWTPETP